MRACVHVCVCVAKWLEHQPWCCLETTHIAPFLAFLMYYNLFVVTPTIATIVFVISNDGLIVRSC